MITGARVSSAFETPEGADYLTLPSIGKSASGSYEARHLPVGFEELIALRSRTIHAALDVFDPDLLIVDKVPRGTRGELDAALRMLRRRGKARVVLGLRDVLDEPAAASRDWVRDQGDTAVDDYYDEVWVYGDPAVFPFSGPCGLPVAVEPKARFTGYLAPPPSEASGGQGPWLDLAPYALCQVGGGEDGAQLAEAFALAPRPPGCGGVVLAGPRLGAEDRSRLHALADRDAGLAVIDFSNNPQPIVAGAQSVVSMGGYNSVCELMALGRRSLIVPRIHPRCEQLIRAERLQELGMVDCLHPDSLTPEAIGGWLRASQAAPQRALPRVDLEGLRRIPRFAARLLKNVIEPREKPCASAT